MQNATCCPHVEINGRICTAGNVKPTRLGALLNAALGYVSDTTEGFVDFDAVPEEGASVQVRPLKLTFQDSCNTPRLQLPTTSVNCYWRCHCVPSLKKVWCECTRTMLYDELRSCKP